jgi:hypothetical protein
MLKPNSRSRPRSPVTRPARLACPARFALAAGGRLAGASV